MPPTTPSKKKGQQKSRVIFEATPTVHKEETGPKQPGERRQPKKSCIKGAEKGKG